MNVLRFTLFARRGLARGAVGRTFEMQIAHAATATLRHLHLLTVMGEIRDQSIRRQILDEGADRDAQNNVIRTAPVAAGSSAAIAILGAKNARKTVVDEGIDVLVRDHINIAAAAAVAAIGTALGDVFFATHGRGAVATIAGVNFNARFVDEFHGFNSNAGVVRLLLGR